MWQAMAAGSSVLGVFVPPPRRKSGLPDLRTNSAEIGKPDFGCGERERGRPALPLPHRRGAAVDVDRGAGDERARVGREEAGEVREFLRLAHAAERKVLGVVAV